MFELFQMGGPLFMGLITIILLSGIVYVLVVFVKSRMTENGSPDYQQVKSIGLFALVVGLLGQMIGLYGAFEAIEQAGSVSPALLAGGFKISSITTLYGLFSFVICYILYFAFSSVRSMQQSKGS